MTKFRSEEWLREQLVPARVPFGTLRTACAGLGTSIQNASDARQLAVDIDTAERALQGIEDIVAPVRSEIHQLRTELSRRVKLATAKPKAQVVEAKRVLGAWRKRERSQQQAAHDEARHKAATEAETASEAGAIVQAAPEPAGPKGTRRVWKMEVTDDKMLRNRLLQIWREAHCSGGTVSRGDPRTGLTAALVVHEPALRKLLASAEGAELATKAGLDGVVRVWSEDVAT